VRREDQAGGGPAGRVERGERGPDRVGVRLDEAGVVVELAQLVDHRSARTDPGPGPVDVLPVLPARRVSAVGAGGEAERTRHAVVAHPRNGVLQHRVPVPVPPVRRERHAVGREVGLDPGEQVAALLVDR
jgi:hypothetical protein